MGGDRNKNLRQMTDRQMSNRNMEDTDRQMSRRRFMSNMDQHQMIDQQSYSSRRGEMTARNPLETNNRDVLEQNNAYINDGSMAKQRLESNMDPMKEKRLFENRLDSLKMPESRQMSATNSRRDPGYQTMADNYFDNRKDDLSDRNMSGRQMADRHMSNQYSSDRQIDERYINRKSGQESTQPQERMADQHSSKLNFSSRRGEMQSYNLMDTSERDMAEIHQTERYIKDGSGMQMSERPMADWHMSNRQMTERQLAMSNRHMVAADRYTEGKHFAGHQFDMPTERRVYDERLRMMSDRRMADRRVERRQDRRHLLPAYRRIHPEEEYFDTLSSDNARRMVATNTERTRIFKRDAEGSSRFSYQVVAQHDSLPSPNMEAGKHYFSHVLANEFRPYRVEYRCLEYYCYY